jgi:NADPH-dependent 2,4-dienoyl-CoA reductase/sulfur reductase-like enzyme
VIIGNGISGISAARHIRKNSNKRLTVISGETDFFFSRTALMYVYMGHMKFEHTQPYENWFWEKNSIELKKAFVTRINVKKNELFFEDESTMTYDKLILALGSKPNKFGWPGQDLKGVMGLYHKQDLANLEQYSIDCHRAVIVGGGLIGIELAEMFRSRNIPVTFLVREGSFWNSVLPNGESEMINDHILEHGIDLRLNSNLKAIRPDENGRVKSVVIEETGEEISCNIVGLTAGVSPNITLLKDTKIKTRKGVLVNRYLETNIPNIYAIGDCAEQKEPVGLRRPIEAVWYTGRMMGETVAQTICGNKKLYNPGPWFNSAKFLDIEYQTYGWVFSEKNKENSEIHFHWKSPCKKKCITIAFHKDTKLFLGINTFGIRMRHEMFDQWLSEQRDVNYVITHLRDANFDPEFYKQYETAIVSHFNRLFNTNLITKKRSWKRILTRSN